ncbi:hypothetical protein ABER20_12090, partial [Cutibacterium acnes]
DRFPGADYLAAVADAGVDVLYVVTGTRTPSDSSSITAIEAAFVHDYRALSEAERDTIGRMVNALATQPKSK